MKYLFALFLALASFGSAQADSQDLTVTTVPFDFVVGNKTFTAGKYSINRISADPQGGLRIQSLDGKTGTFSFPRHRGQQCQTVNLSCSSATKATNISWQRSPPDWKFIP